MHQITDADREAAQTLRAVLADLSGFWFKADDDSPLCAALAHHRVDAEQRAEQRAERRAERRIARMTKAADDHIHGPNIRLVRSGPSAAASDTPAAA